MRIYDPHDKDPARRFKAALLNEGFAVSPDGVQWTKLDLPAIPSSDEGNFSYDPSEALFIHSVKRGGPFGRSVAIATSRDFTTWRDYDVVFHADDLDQVEIQDATGKPIPGFALEDCPEIYGDRIRQVVGWNQASDVRTLAGKPIRLRFVMNDADLYAIQFP